MAVNNAPYAGTTAKSETYAAAKERLLTGLESLGWKVVRTHACRALKVPHATSPDGVRLDFHAQAIHVHGGNSTHLNAKAIDAERLAVYARNIVRAEAHYAAHRRAVGGAE